MRKSILFQAKEIRRKREMDDALRELVVGLRETVGDSIDSITLYGSYARGEQTEESDVDIAMMLNQPLDYQREDKMDDWIIEMDLKYNKVFSVVNINKSMFDQWVDVLPFYRNIRKEGIILWSKES